MKESLSFYNQFDKKLISDFVLGNKRIVKAITYLGQRIPADSKNILDIGCGIGWSTYEFAKTFKEAKVMGIDLSPVLIDVGNKLFNLPNLQYSNHDLTAQLPEEQYDAVVMIDVYEHIPLNERKKFHDLLSMLLRKQGRLLLACPSKYHQEYLRKYQPEGLQPVDEDVDFKEIQTLAEDIGGEVLYFEYQSIWRSNDYFHSVIEIEPKYGNRFERLNNKIFLEAPEERKRLVKRVFGDLYVFPDKKKDSFGDLVKKIKRKLS